MSLCKSPAKRVRAITYSHRYMLFCRLEYFSIKPKFNLTALRTKLYIAANRAALDELENMKSCFYLKIYYYNRNNPKCELNLESNFDKFSYQKNNKKQEIK